MTQNQNQDDKSPKKKKHTFILFFSLSLVLALLSLSYFIAESVIKFTVAQSLQLGWQLFTISPLESVNLLFNATLLVFFILLIPFCVIGFYIWSRDALYAREKKAILKIKWFVVLASLGAMTGYLITRYVILPFLTTVNHSLGLPATATLESVVSLIVVNTLIMVLIFQIPLIAKILEKIEIIHRHHLTKMRKYVYVTFVVITAIVTPTTDAISLVIMLAPVVILYELSVFIVKPCKYSGKDTDNEHKGSECPT